MLITVIRTHVAYYHGSLLLSRSTCGQDVEGTKMMPHTYTLYQTTSSCVALLYVSAINTHASRVLRKESNDSRNQKDGMPLSEQGCGSGWFVDTRRLTSWSEPVNLGKSRRKVTK